MPFIKVTDVWVQKPRILADSSVEMNVGTKEMWVNWDMIFTMNPVPFEISHQWPSSKSMTLPLSFQHDSKEYKTLTRIGTLGNEAWGHILETPEEIMAMLEPKKADEPAAPTKSKRGRPKGSKNKPKTNESNTQDTGE